jgi:hypothetical protein
MFARDVEQRNPRPFALAAYFVPALPVQHLALLAAVAANPTGSSMSAQGLGALAAALRGGSLLVSWALTRTVIQYDTACWLCGLV